MALQDVAGLGDKQAGQDNGYKIPPVTTDAAIDVTRLNQWFVDAEQGNNEWREQAKDDVNLYGLDHWDAKTKQTLIEEGRPPLVIPKIYPVVNFLDGYFRQNRLDIIYKPRKNTTTNEADVLTQVVKQLIDLSNADARIAEWFFLGLVTGRSWITGEVDYTYDQDKGDLKLVVPDPLSVFPDPNSTEYDYSDGRYICRVVMTDYHDLLESFPDKESAISTQEYAPEELDTHTKNRIAYENMGNNNKVATLKASKVRVKEWYWLERQERVQLVNSANPNSPIEVPNNPSFIGDITASKQGMTVLNGSNKKVNVLHRTLQCGGEILEDYQKPLGEVNDIPFVQFIVKRIRKNIWSVVTPLKDVQKEVDKGRSQALHILNALAKDETWIEENSVDVEDYKAKGGKSRYIGTYKKGSQPPVHRNFPNLSEQSFQREEIAELDIKAISGVNTDLQGQPGQGGKEPAKNLQLRQKQGLVVLEPIFDNFEISHQILGQKLATVVVKSGLYDVQEIMNIVDIPQPDVPPNVNPQMPQGGYSDPRKQQEAMKTMQAVQALFADSDKVKRFNVKTTTRPSSPTVRMADFMSLMQINEAFPGLIDPEILVEASDVSQKEQILTDIKQKKEAAAQAAQMGGGPGGPPSKPTQPIHLVHHVPPGGQ